MNRQERRAAGGVAPLRCVLAGLKGGCIVALIKLWPPWLGRMAGTGPAFALTRPTKAKLPLTLSLGVTGVLFEGALIDRTPVSLRKARLRPSRGASLIPRMEKFARIVCAT
jgi:hypothetical protein